MGKRVFLLLLWMVVSSILWAQTDTTKQTKNIIAANLSVWAPKAKYERRISKMFSVGIVVKSQFMLHTGAKFEPFARWYFRKNAPFGLFVHAKASVGIFHTKKLETATVYQKDFEDSYLLPSTRFYTYGGGAQAGYQLAIGKRKNGSLEVYGGVQAIYSSLYMSHVAFQFQKWSIQFPMEAGARFGFGW